MPKNTKPTDLEFIDVPSNILDLAIEYEFAKNSETKKQLQKETEQNLGDLLMSVVGMGIFSLGTWFCYAFTSWAWAENPGPFKFMFGFFALLIGLIIFACDLATLGIFLKTLFMWPINKWRLSKFKNIERTEGEEAIFTDKLAKMAYSITSSAKAVNALIEELHLREEMIAEGINIKFDQVRAREILTIAHERVNKQTRKLQTLLKYRQKREAGSIDLVEVTSLLDETSASALCEVQADIEIDSDNVFAALETTLAIDDLNAEFGDVDAIVRKRESRDRDEDKKKKAAMARTKATG